MMIKPVRNFLALPYVILMTANESCLPGSMTLCTVTLPLLPSKVEACPPLSSLFSLL